jgi:uncharacterized membrane protein YhaH (DUF805 family)
LNASVACCSRFAGAYDAPRSGGLRFSPPPHSWDLLVALEATFGSRASLILYPPFFWIVAALAVKRLRDRGRHPAWLVGTAHPDVGTAVGVRRAGIAAGDSG